MSLALRLTALTQAIGADIKALFAIDAYLKLADESSFWQPVTHIRSVNINIASPSFGTIGPNLNERVFLVGQTDQRQNGPWIYKGSANPMVRADDGINTYDFIKGKKVYALLSDSVFIYTGPSNPTIGTDPLPFVMWEGERHFVQDLYGINQYMTEQDSRITKLESGASGIPVVSSLPTTNLVDGMEVRLKLPGTAAAGGPGYWHCQYDASITGAYRWWVLGGTSLYVEDTNSYLFSISGGAQYAVYDLPGNAVLTVPFGGIYDMSIYTTVYGASVANNDLRVFLAVGSTNYANGPMGSLTAGGEQTFTMAPRRLTAAKSVVARMKYLSSLTSFSATAFDQRLVAAPVRIG